jgi:DnaJ family protein C protein 28
MSQSKYDARQRAEEYQQPVVDQEKSTTTSKTRSEKEWRDLISQRIEEAMAAGAFDNLPGKGKPIDVGPEPFVPADMQMANSLLKSNQLSPAWISDRNEMLAAVAQMRQQIVGIAAEYAQAFTATSDADRRTQLGQAWRTQIERWRGEVAALNRRIDIHNLSLPLAHLEIFKVSLEEELRGFTVYDLRFTDYDVNRKS